MTCHTPLSCVLAGAAPDTGNLGVSALCFSTLDGIARRVPGAALTVFDHGRGLRRFEGGVVAGRASVMRCGASNTRRLHRPESLRRNLCAARLGFGGGPALNAVAGADAVLDVSGGDSFSDIYGMRRLRTVSLPKRLAIRLGTPLILLPQTYGPFTSDRARRLAVRIIRAAAQCWARDERSFEALKDFLGAHFVPARHRCGVDLAFALERIEPDDLPDALTDWLEDAATEGAPVAGLNISGLIHNQPEAAARQYGLTLDYPAAVRGVMNELLSEPDSRVLLVPHVAPTRGDSPEDDARACREAREALPRDQRERVMVAPVFDDPRRIKWLISRCDWFCGTRMHATIAALSTGVPTATLAYSGKAQGVFETCGQGDHVADMRSLTTDEAVDRVRRSWLDRDAARSSLARAIPGVLDRAEAQMDEIVAAATGREASEFAQRRMQESQQTAEAPAA